jgi:hypothetical protein
MPAPFLLYLQLQKPLLPVHQQAPAQPQQQGRLRQLLLLLLLLGAAAWLQRGPAAP